MTLSTNSTSCRSLDPDDLFIMLFPIIDLLQSIALTIHIIMDFPYAGDFKGNPEIELGADGISLFGIL